MSMVVINAARSRMARRQNPGQLGKLRSDPENMICDVIQGKAYKGPGVCRKGSLDGFTNGDTKRRVLSDSCNIPHTEAVPTAAKKSKGQKIPVICSRAKQTTIPGTPGLKLKKKGGVKSTKSFSIPTPHRVLRDVEDMDTDDLDNVLYSMFTRFPTGVVDIDANVTDPNLCPAYAQDITNYVQCLEQRFVLNTDYLENTEVTPYMRLVLIDWLIQVQDHLSLHQETLHLCVALVDRFLSIKPVPLSRMQLLGITALFVASKFYERLCPEVSRLIHLTDDTYTYEEVIKTELDVLITLQFDLSVPSPVFFLDRLLLVDDHFPEVEHMSKYLLDLILTNYNQVQFVPSLRASAALFLARFLMDIPDPWTLSLAYYSKYCEKDLLPCSEVMATALAKAPRFKIQGARQKYNHTRFHNISHHPQLKNVGALTDYIAKRIQTT